MNLKISAMIGHNCVLKPISIIKSPLVDYKSGPEKINKEDFRIELSSFKGLCFPGEEANLELRLEKKKKTNRNFTSSPEKIEFY